MKATAETILDDAAGVIFNQFYGGSSDLAEAAASLSEGFAKVALSTLPVTLEQLAGIANGELVLVNRTELLNPLSKKARQEIEGYIEACSGDEPSGAALQVVLERLDRLAAALVASPEKDKTT